MSEPGAPRDANGYRRTPTGGPTIRADVVDVYIAREASAGGFEFLQALRAREPLRDTWHPVMGHCEAGESAVRCAIREMREEVGLGATAAPGAAPSLWALEQVHPFFIATLDAVVLSPRFVALAPPGWEPALNAEHTDCRWVAERDTDRLFMWPGQRAACREALEILRDPCGATAQALRVRDADDAASRA